MLFTEMLQTVRIGQDLSQADLAKALGFSPQYLSDIENGRRLPSVKFVNRICDRMDRGPKGRLAWHKAGAKTHGWEV